MRSGCILGLYSRADTGCSGKHAYVDEFFDSKSFNVTGFKSTLGSIDNLPIAHVLYIVGKEDVNLVLLKHNNTVYVGDETIDSLATIQCEDNDVIINLHPKTYDPNNNN